MKKLYKISIINTILLVSIIIQFVFFPVTALGTNTNPASSRDRENDEAARGFLSLQYGNNWRSIPTDSDIKKAIEAYPKTLKRDDKFLGKPSYNEFVTTFSLGEAVKKHSTILAAENISNANHVFVKCTAVETVTHHIYNVATGRTEVSTDTRQVSGYLQLRQESDGTFTLGKGEINNDIYRGFTDTDGKIIYADGWIGIKSDKYKIFGKIVDANGKPMPQLYLLIMVNNKEVLVPVDSEGNYEYSFDLPSPMTEETKKARIRIILSHIKDSKEWFKLVMNPRPSSAPDNIVTVVRFDLDESKKEMEKDINFNTADLGYVSKTNGKSDEAITNIGGLEKLKKLSVIYKNYHDAFKFARDKLKVDFSNNIPLKIEVESSHPTVFDPYNKMIMLQDEHTLNVSSNKWTQLHEFGHYTQYTAYGKRFPANVAHEGDPRNYPHWGYVNDDTGDSFIEGFANYFPCIVGKYGDDPIKEPDVMGVFGSINDPWVAWAQEGNMEEFAFASVMWDLSEKSGIPYKEVWDVFSTDRLTFYNYYKELIVRYKDKKQTIDSVYIDHGIYAIKLEGNHQYDESEPYIDSNGNGRWDSGEYFVDYSLDPKTGDIFMGTTKDMTIGQSSNYERIAKRYSTFRFRNSYLKVDGNPGDALTVKVKYQDGSYGYSYTAPVYDGKIYMCRLPGCLKADISVVSPSENGDGKVYYKTTTMELDQKFISTKNQDTLDTVSIKDAPSKPGASRDVQAEKSRVNYFLIILAAVICIILGIFGVSLINKNKPLAVVFITLMVLVFSVSSFYVFKSFTNSLHTIADGSQKPENVVSTENIDEPAVPPDNTNAPEVPSESQDTEKANAPAEGKLYYESGALRYEGRLSGETANGYGIFYFENGNVQYIGYLLDGKAHGQGVRYDEDGSLIYEGEFLNGSYEGYGILNYSNGDHYEGDFVNSRPHGSGTYLWASGDKYVGEFKEGKMDGTGIMTRKDGTVFHDGLWSGGKRVTESSD